MSPSPPGTDPPSPKEVARESEAEIITVREPPHGVIAPLLKRGEVVPFLGAGVNFGIRRRDDHWTLEPPNFLPSGSELSLHLARLSSFPSPIEWERKDLAKVASYYVENNDRDLLRSQLREVFNHDFAPCDIHTYLAEISRSTRLLIITTNYDDLTERALIKAQTPFDLVIHPTDNPEWAEAVLWGRYDPGSPESFKLEPSHPHDLDTKTSLDDTTILYKMHGTVDRLLNEWDSYVITEEDYVDFLSRMTKQMAVPAMFIRHFASRRFLFMGYGLRDWNLRVVLRTLPMSEKPGERRSWAIQSGPSIVDQSLWNSKGVNIYNQDINQFVAKLRTY